MGLVSRQIARSPLVCLANSTLQPLSLLPVAKEPFLRPALVFGLWKPWSQAYAGEKGKNFARKEDLNEILAEVRAVTATQKEIESKLAGDLWNRQMRWNQKKEIYGALLEALDDLSRAYMALQIALQLKADPLAQNLQSEMQKKMNSRMANVSAAHDAFAKAFSLAHIFTSQECTGAISKCFSEMKWRMIQLLSGLEVIS